MTAIDARGFAATALRDADWRHGLRLAFAVVLSDRVSTTVHPPESFRAVMSALIVVRPTIGSALGAGRNRGRGTTIGTAVGLAGVWLHHACATTPIDADTRAGLATAVCDALTTLRAWATADAPVGWLAAPVRLPLQDLAQLRHFGETNQPRETA